MAVKETALKALASSILSVTLFSHYERSEVISPQNLNSSFASISSMPSMYPPILYIEASKEGCVISVDRALNLMVSNYI
jgi:hypothetical protein